MEFVLEAFQLTSPKSIGKSEKASEIVGDGGLPEVRITAEEEMADLSRPRSATNESTSRCDDDQHDDDHLLEAVASPSDSDSDDD